MLKGAVEPRQAPARWVQSLSRDDYNFAPESGLWEAAVDVGTDVVKGDALGYIHFLENPDRAPLTVTADADGVVVANRAPSIVGQGDCVAVLAHDTDPRRLP